MPPSEVLMYLSSLYPDVAHIVSLLAVVVVGIIAVGLGGLVGARSPAPALVAGWGVAGTVAVVIGTLTPLKLDLGLGMLVPLGVVGLVRIFLRLRATPAERTDWTLSGRVVLLSVPLVLMIAGMHPYQWDSFSYWLPNLAYLYTTGHFPSLGHPSPTSAWPAYPYGLPLVGYSVSLLLGRFDEAAGIQWNLCLIVATGAAIAGLLRARTSEDSGSRQSAQLPTWSIAASGLLFATLFAPSFIPKIAFSNYADSASACTFAIVLTLFARAFGAGEETNWASVGVVSGWAFAALVNLRKNGLELFGLLAIGMIFCMLAHRRRARHLGELLGTMTPAPIAAGVLWSRYAGREIPGGAHYILPFADWHWRLWPSTLHHMLLVAANKGGYFVLLLLILGVAGAALVRPRALTPMQYAAVVPAAMAAVGHLAFLAFAYLAGSFSRGEAAVAESMWRYSTEVGLAAMAAIASLVPAATWRNAVVVRYGAILLIVVALFLPDGLVRFLRNDIRSNVAYLRSVARSVADVVPADRPLLAIDLGGNGSNLVPVQYQITVGDQLVGKGKTRKMNFLYHPTAKQLTRLQEEASFVWTYRGDRATSRLLGVPLADGASYLLMKSPRGFVIARRFPYPAWPPRGVK